MEGLCWSDVCQPNQKMYDFYPAEKKTLTALQHIRKTDILSQSYKMAMSCPALRVGFCPCDGSAVRLAASRPTWNLCDNLELLFNFWILILCTHLNIACNLTSNISKTVGWLNIGQQYKQYCASDITNSDSTDVMLWLQHNLATLWRFYPWILPPISYTYIEINYYC
jgi:hypothetical protein